MLEDLTMEKKTSQNWASLNPTKGIETKKPQGKKQIVQGLRKIVQYMSKFIHKVKIIY